MRRLLFLFSCGLALWVAIGARDVLREKPPAPADDAAVMDLAARSHVMSVQFGAALDRAGLKVRKVDHALAGAADRLNSVAGD